MTYVTAYSTTYDYENDWDGKTVRSKVTEITMITEFGLVHYKHMKYARSARVFTDLDRGTKLSIGEVGDYSKSKARLERHEQFRRMGFTGRKNGCAPMYEPYTNTEDLLSAHPDMFVAILKNADARKAWELVSGIATVVYDDDDWEEIDDVPETYTPAPPTKEQQRTAIKNEAMAEADSQWGMF